MARFLYAWELGGNLGHVGSAEPVAERLRRQGHTVTFAVRDTRACPALLGGRFAWLQAPRCGLPPAPAPPIGYADILAGAGYADPDVLAGLTVAWRTLLELARPDLVLADHAPTAILAARTLGIPVMLLGTGFTAPPMASPLPPMRPWEAIDAAGLAALAAREATVLATVNAVLARCGTAPLARLCDLFDVAEPALATLPELDHYPRRGAARYWGVLARLRDPAAAAVGWPPGAGPRIFGYLRQAPPLAAAMIAAIGATGHPAIVVCPDVADVDPPANVALVARPVGLDRMTLEADVAIAQGAGTVGAFLMAGKPVLAVASHLEQFLLGLRVAQLGAGIAVRAEDGAPPFRAALERLLADDAFARHARAFAARYPDRRHEAVVGFVCARAAALAGCGAPATDGPA